jgi:hypothetical protein
MVTSLKEIANKLLNKQPKKYSFEGVKHVLKIDQDIWDHTQQYVVDQINIMKRHGSQPEPPLTQAQFNDLVYVTARYPQQVRNLRKQNETHETDRPNAV